MRGFNLAEDTKVVMALKPQTNGGALVGAYVSLKGYAIAHILVETDQANAATEAITIEQASAIAGTGSKVITNVVPIWANQDTATNDTLVRQTDAVNFTTSAAVKQKQVLFRIDPASLDVANGFDCITVKVGTSNVANIVGATYILAGARFHEATPETAVLD